MNEIELWVIILGGMAVTYLIRLSFVVIIPPEQMPEVLGRGLVYIPPAVLAAILFPELVLADGAVNLSLSNYQLLAGIVAAVVAWRLKNTWLTIGSGMLVLWLLTSV